ncbi:MAG: hypothetical protein WCG55_03450 [bacterium]
MQYTLEVDQRYRLRIAKEKVEQAFSAKDCICATHSQSKPGTFKVTLKVGSNYETLSQEAEEVFVKTFNCPKGSLKATKHVNTFHIDITSWLAQKV